MKDRLVRIGFAFGLAALLVGALTAVPATASFPGPLTVDTASEGYSCSNGVCTFPSGTVAASYAAPITSTGGSGPTPYTWSVVAGSLPAGLSLTPSYGVYSAYVYGTPTTAQTSTFTLQVRDGVGGTAQQAFTLTINPNADTFQPDALIKLKSDKNYLGNDIYNLDATDQTRTETAKRGQSRTFYIQVQNDGNATDSFNIHGDSGGYTGGSQITIAYFAGKTDITFAVTTGAYNTGSVAPGGSATIDMIITVKPIASFGNILGSLVTATSTDLSTAQDAVKGAVKVAFT